MSPLFQRLRPLTHHQVLAPLVAAIILAVLWIATLHIVEKNRWQAHSEAIVRTQRLLDAYEAQLLRALGEVNQSIKLIDYAYSERGRNDTLMRLAHRNLLLPSLLFTTRVVDLSGRVIASSQESARTWPVDGAMLSHHASSDETYVGPPRTTAPATDPVIQLTRRIGNPEDGDTHIVEVTMPASYLVSDYDEVRFGQHGVLALLGTDGVFRVKRTGARIDVGQRVASGKLPDSPGSVSSDAVLAASPWDGERRYIAARPLYGYPLTVVVALPESEVLRDARTEAYKLLTLAAASSAVIVLIAALLMWVGRRSTLLRQREGEVKAAHARQVEHLAYHDALTSLPNRAHFARALQAHLADETAKKSLSALLFLDLDGFKKVNDVQGHQAGDELLKQVAARLTESVRSDDFTARLGGDEFIVLLRSVKDEAEAQNVARRIIQSVALPYRIDGEESRVTVSIGAAMYPADARDELGLMRRADEAMYKAKERGKNNVQFYAGGQAVTA